MSEPKDFAIGDRVNHPVMGNGTVTNATADHNRIYVTYDARDRRGNATNGIYDADWFRICGFLTKIEDKR